MTNAVRQRAMITGIMKLVIVSFQVKKSIIKFI
jgi:hypothetical protein